MSQHHTSKWIRADKRLAIYLRDNCECAYCGARPGVGFDLTLDHIKPASKGGDNGEGNLITACRSCNSSRQDAPLAVFLRSIGCDESEVRSRSAKILRQRKVDLAAFRAQAKSILAESAWADVNAALAA